MKTLFYDNRQLLILTILLVFVGGLSAAFTLPRLEDPYILGRTAVIVTSLPGASAQRVEALVTEKLEEELQEVSEIKEIDSVSRAGLSLITVELKGSITDIEPVWTDVRDRLEDARSGLPPAASKPDFDDTRGPWAFSLILGLKWTLEDAPQMGILDRLAEELADRLRNLPGTQLVRLYGEPAQEITVTVDADRLSELGLTAADLSAGVAAADSKTSAGILRSSRRDLFIEVEGELDSLQRIADIPLLSSQRGGALRLGDVAQIERRPRDPQTEAALVDGQPAILIAARVEPDRRLDLWNQDALALVSQFESGLSSAVGLKRIFQQNRYTVQRLSGLLANLAAGMLIVMLVLVFTMGWRAALLVGAALPLSSAAVLFGLQLLDVPLQQMSVTGLIIALGLLIDNAIVTVDEVGSRLKKGLEPRQAIAQSVGHLFVPLLGSTLTTVLAFLPILLLSGSVGEFVGTIAVSVVLAILSSFFFAMTVVATLTGLAASAASSGRWFSDGVRIPALSRAYRGLLEGIARRPWRGVALALALPLLGFLLAPSLENQFFPPADRDQFYVQMWMPSDSSLASTRQQAQRLEAILREDPAIREVDWLIGASAPTFYYNMLMNQDGSSRYAHALVRASSYDQMRQAVPRLQERIDRELPQSQTVLRLLGQGPPVDAPLEIRLFGPSLTELRRLGDELRRHLFELPQILHSRATLRRGEPKIWVKADEDEARQAGMNLTQVARQLQDSLEGSLGGSLLEETEEMPLRIRYSDQRRSDWQVLASLNLVSEQSEGWIPLSGLAELELRPELEAITRRDGQRVNLIQAYIHADALAPQLTEDFLQLLRGSGFQLPPGYRMEVGGEAEEQQEATANLLVYVPVLGVLMLASLVLSFRSFALSGVIGLVAVLSVGLGLFFIFLSGYPWGFMAMIGTAGLIGVAINDSIVVLAAIRAHGGDSVVEPVLESTRHVISTTLTTAAGFMPLILSGGDFWPPLAVVIAGGVTGATLIALVFTPSAYLIASKGGRRPETGNRQKGSRKKKSGAPKWFEPNPSPLSATSFLVSLPVSGFRSPVSRLLPLLAALILSTGLAMASDQWVSEAEGTVAGKDPVVQWWESFADPLLERYILLAAEHNHDIRAARTRIDQARALLKKSRSRRLPEVDASADYVNARLSENGVGAGSAAARAGLTQLEDDFFRSGFDARWEIDVFGSIRKQVRASEARLEEAREDRRAVLLSVLAEVARSYAELRGAQQRLQVVESNLRIQSETLELVENKVKTGLARRIDAQRARALQQSTRSAMAPLQSEIRLAAFRLSVLTGRPPAALVEELLRVNPLPTPPDLVPLGLPSELLARRPDLRRAERRIAAAGADIKSARADLYPRFTLRGSAGLESGAIGSLLSAASGTWALVPGLHLPLFNRGRLKSRVKASQAVLEGEQIRFEQAYLLALEEVEGALVRYANRQKEVHRLQSASQASAESVRLARILYQRGLSDYLTVLDAERSLNDIQLRLATLQTRLALDVIALYKALGGGWEVYG